jgi:G3E family GTPase
LDFDPGRLAAFLLRSARQQASQHLLIRGFPLGYPRGAPQFAHFTSSLGSWPAVLRSKGFFWLATRHERAGAWSQAGAACRTDAAGFWWTVTPRDQWPEDDEQRVEIERLRDEPWGDRRQEMVVIGQALDQDALTSRLNGSLLTDEELKLGPERWAAELPDPFLPWGVGEETSTENTPTQLHV